MLNGMDVSRITKVILKNIKKGTNGPFNRKKMYFHIYIQGVPKKVWLTNVDIL